MRSLLRTAAFALALAGCHWFQPPAPGQDDCNPGDNPVDAPVHVQMDVAGSQLALPGSFYASPYPSVLRSVNPPAGCPAHSPLMDRLKVEQLRQPDDAYATTAGVFFGLSSAAHPTRVPPSFGAGLPVLRLPDGGEETVSLDDGGTALAGVAGLDALPSAFLFRLDVPRHRLHPVVAERGRVNPANGCAPNQDLLTLLPVQGRPLDPSAVYVAVVTKRLSEAPEPGGVVMSLCEGVGPAPGGFDAGTADLYQQAFQVLRSPEFELKCDEIGGLTVFRTTDPTAEFRRFVDFARAQTPLALADGGVSLEKGRCEASRFCTFSGTVRVPQFQHGTPPYAPYFDWEGAWETDGGTPVLQGYERARVVVTLPRQPMPPQGFPAVVLVRAGAGGNGDPLVDRGPSVAAGCAYATCEGPAQVFASAGFAGVTVDGPLVGQSRAAPLLVNEDLAIFDFLNPLAMRDNVRQSALELALVPQWLATLEVDPGEVAKCTGLDTQGAAARFDGSRLAVFAHSMGASIAPLALAVQRPGPSFGAVIFSGSGGSFIENAIYKREPVPVTAAASLYGYEGACQPHPRDPELSLLQRVLEPADSQVYARDILSNDAGTTRQVLMVQGLIDHYILPPIADTMILGEGLDLAVTPHACGGRPDCDRHEEPLGCAQGVASADYPSISTLLPLSGATVRALPVQGNRVGPHGERLTAVVVQHHAVRPEACSACVDGHEVAYEVDLARHQQECFLKSFAADGGARVPADGHLFEECPP